MPGSVMVSFLRSRRAEFFVHLGGWTLDSAGWVLHGLNWWAFWMRSTWDHPGLIMLDMASLAAIVVGTSTALIPLSAPEGRSAGNPRTDWIVASIALLVFQLVLWMLPWFDYLLFVYALSGLNPG